MSAGHRQVSLVLGVILTGFVVMPVASFNQEEPADGVGGPRKWEVPPALEATQSRTSRSYFRTALRQWFREAKYLELQEISCANPLNTNTCSVL